MINNIQDFENYIRLKLGAPILNIELDSTQIIQEVSDAVDTFLRYTYGDSTYRDNIVIMVSAGISAYQLPNYVSNVIDINGPNGDNDLNKLFTPMHELLYNNFYNGGVIGNGNGVAANIGGAFNISNYSENMMYLSEINGTFLRSYYCAYSNNTNILRIWPTPEISHPSMLTIWRNENAVDLYNNILLKKLAVASCRIAWAGVLSKYAISFPGNGTINWQAYMDRGEKEYESAMQAIVLETRSPEFFVG